MVEGITRELCVSIYHESSWSMSKVQQRRDSLISHQMEGWEFPGSANGKEIRLSVPEMGKTRV